MSCHASSLLQSVTQRTLYVFSNKLRGLTDLVQSIIKVYQ